MADKEDKIKDIDPAIKVKSYESKSLSVSLACVLEDSGDWRVEKTIAVLDEAGDLLGHRLVPVDQKDVDAVIAIAEK